MTSLSISGTHEGRLDGHVNMARDAELLQLAEEGKPSFRVYGWNGPWVSLGFQQVAERDLLDANLVPWTKRPTGGKAVLHGHDVTVGLALPLTAIGDPEKLSRSVRTVYRAIAEPLVRALNDCGVPAALAEETRFAGRGPRSADCFAHVSPNDIVNTVTGMKACGVALRLTSGAVLVQASIPNGKPLIDPQQLFAQPAPVSNSEWDTRGFFEAFEYRLGGL